MKVAQTTTGSHRRSAPCQSDDASVESSDELVDRPLDNREHLFPILGVDEILELGALADVLVAVSRLLLVGEMAARHQVEKLEDAAAVALAPIALELLIEREAEGQ